jgi:hypothetical protein
MVCLLSCVPLVLFKELFCIVTVRCSLILGEKAGVFFGGGDECLYIDGGILWQMLELSPMAYSRLVSLKAMIVWMDEGLVLQGLFLVIFFLMCA